MVSLLSALAIEREDRRLPPAIRDPQRSKVTSSDDDPNSLSIYRAPHELTAKHFVLQRVALVAIMLAASCAGLPNVDRGSKPESIAAISFPPSRRWKAFKQSTWSQCLP